MLSPADAAVVRRDPALPDLALLLDPERLHASLERTLDRPLARPVITYLRYKRGQSCLAACRVDVDGVPVDFAVKHHRADADKLQNVMARPAIAGPLGSGRFVLADTPVVVSVFPNDGKLKRLAWLGSEQAVADVARQIDGIDRAARPHVHTLNFNPERRFVGRLTIGGRDLATIRCYHRNDYVSAADKPKYLHPRGPLNLARPLLRNDKNRVIALEWLPGRSLEDAIADGVAPADDIRLVGAALLELHHQNAPTLAARTPAGEAGAMLALARDLCAICPEIEAEASWLATQLADRLTATDQRTCAIHGDFYARQVVLHDGRAGLLDLDGASRGDPAIDLGRFRADLEFAVIRDRLDADTVEATTEALLEGYERAGGVRPPHRDLYGATQLFYLSTHPFRRRERSWSERSAAVVERARHLLEAHDRAGAARVVVPRAVERSRVIDPFGVGSDASMSFLAPALDPEHMGQQLAKLPAFAASASVEVRNITVTRLKPGRRCLIAYGVALHQERAAEETVLIGKVRARGLDAATHDLQRGLWQGAFGSGAPDGIHVPEPIGMIASLQMTLQRWVPGASFERLLEGPDAPQRARRAAAAIAKLHNVSSPAIRRHTVDDELRLLAHRLTSMGDEEPALRDRLGRLLEGCRTLATRIESHAVCGIHRDFYPNQLLADNDRLYLLDLDLYSEGPPALDVGNFAAHIDEYSLRRFGDPNRLVDARRAFVSAYVSLSTRTTPEAIEAAAMLTLARHVALSRQFTDRQPFTEALLALCEARVSETSLSAAVGARGFGQ